MKAKMLMILFSFVMLTGCCTNGCGGGNSCGGCDVGYWSTSCPTPNSGGASEAAFTDIANVCKGSSCAIDYYAGCGGSNGCNSSTNW
jgi:hypothetical protein